MCSGSEAGSYVRLINFVYHSTLGLRVIEKKELGGVHHARSQAAISGTSLVLIRYKSGVNRVPGFSVQGTRLDG